MTDESYDPGFPIRNSRGNPTLTSNANNDAGLSINKVLRRGRPNGREQTAGIALSFNRFLRVAFQGSPVTSDAGLFRVRELDERLGLGERIAPHLTDSRGKNAQLPLTDLLRQSLYSRLAGCEDVKESKRAAKPLQNRPFRFFLISLDGRGMAGVIGFPGRQSPYRKFRLTQTRRATMASLHCGWPAPTGTLLWLGS